MMLPDPPAGESWSTHTEGDEGHSFAYFKAADEVKWAMEIFDVCLYKNEQSGILVQESDKDPKAISSHFGVFESMQVTAQVGPAKEIQETDVSMFEKYNQGCRLRWSLASVHNKACRFLRRLHNGIPMSFATAGRSSSSPFR